MGFRPALQRLVLAAGLGGWVQNRSGRVRLELVGPLEGIDAFLAALPGRLPPRARLEALVRHEPHPAAAGEGEGFEIRESEADEEFRVSIPADLAVCPRCLEEVFDPASRFYGYPFTTCTDCGPRYTVVDTMPYDRERTSLSAFPLCPRCRREYASPDDRRFHAESIACPECGPRLSLLDAAGRPLEGDPLRGARVALAEGKIVAVKGLGGFLLAVDAFSEAAVRRLRERKHRPHKPLAVMARDLAAAEGLCRLGEPERALMASPVSPIVILPVRAEALARGLPVALLSPDTGQLGVMLPTTPLHALLMRPLAGDPTPAFELLVMTSGNRGGEPICTGNEEALDRLRGIADLFLCHDRPIRLRCDDSLVASGFACGSAGTGGFACGSAVAGPQVWRRARGYAPEGLRLSRPLGRAVLALGAELKNTVALGFEDEIVLSPHIGDLETPAACDGMEQVARCLPAFLRREPQSVAVDLHPDMHSTRFGRRLAREAGLPLVAVQHHHAHGAAAMAEYGLEQALCLVFDGTGLGADGAIWGAELLRVEGAQVERLATFCPAPLPGADAAVLHPARQLAARWLDQGRELPEQWRRRLGLTGQELSLLALQVRRGLRAPRSHAAGRLFDAVSAALGLAPSLVTYEGQAAIRLEAAALRVRDAGGRRLAFREQMREGLFCVDWGEVFAAWLEEAPQPEDRALWARAFHEALARAALRMVEVGLERHPGLPVTLSGGVFMNRLLTGLLEEAMSERGLRVFTPRRVPPNDGAVALGQAWIAGGGA